MLSMGYITSKQASIWDLRRKGHTQSAIAKRLKRSIQFVHKTLNITDARITKAILETAKLHRISLQGDFDLTHGIAFGFDERFQMEAAITYSHKYGIQTWYKDDGDCTTCRIHDSCREEIYNLFTERHYPLPNKHKTISPRELSEHLFHNLKQGNNIPGGVKK